MGGGLFTIKKREENLKIMCRLLSRVVKWFSVSRCRCDPEWAWNAGTIRMGNSKSLQGSAQRDKSWWICNAVLRARMQKHKERFVKPFLAPLGRSRVINLDQVAANSRHFNTPQTQAEWQQFPKSPFKVVITRLQHTVGCNRATVFKRWVRLHGLNSRWNCTLD